MYKERPFYIDCRYQFAHTVETGTSYSKKNIGYGKIENSDLSGKQTHRLNETFTFPDHEVILWREVIFNKFDVGEWSNSNVYKRDWKEVWKFDIIQY